MPVDPERPFVLTADAAGGPRITALNAAATDAGLAAGDLLADARAKTGTLLQVRPADPAAAAAALRRLALWATRYTPSVSAWDAMSGADGFFLDVTGSAHLLGGEEGLLADLAQRLRSFDLPARMAVADTPGASWAFARWHRAQAFICTPGQHAQALAPLPVEALRLTPDTHTALRRLGFKRIGVLMDKPRAPLAARFPAELLHRLDQALGHVPEPLACLKPPPVYHRMRHLIEPIMTQEAIVLLAERLMQELVPDLVRDAAGARALQLILYRVDGETSSLDIGLSMQTRSAPHVARLIALRLDRIVDTIDAGFGFETIGLSITACERMQERQMDITSRTDADGRERCAALIDGLRQRLGPHSVRRLQPVASHLPERAETACAPTSAAAAWETPDVTRRRPPLMLPRAEPAEVVALVPEGPPRRFRWRGVTHCVAHAQGPERIADEWWRQSASRQPRWKHAFGVTDQKHAFGTDQKHAFGVTRDYYLVENDTGRRFWLYREGLYGRETTEPRWFVQGLFA